VYLHNFFKFHLSLGIILYSETWRRV